MRTRMKILLATGPAVLTFAAAAAGATPPGANYPWVQPPAWIPIAAIVNAPAVPGSGYQWVQPPAWIPIA